jgi:hypothetical protein
MTLPLTCVALGLSAIGAPAQTADLDIVFMEPAESTRDDLPTYVLVEDSAQLATYHAWLDNASARWALTLYADAVAEVLDRGISADDIGRYYIALEPQGNYAAVGFRLVEGDESTVHPRTPFMILDAQDWRFTTTLLHETGHMVLALLAGGQEIPDRNIAAIPHTTAALTDRGTALDEGYAIHLETVVAHFTPEPWLVNRYRHGQFLFGDQPGFLAEYFKHSADLLTFSQTVARYNEIRDNNFAFQSAYKEPDYLRIQMEKARDFSSLRDANQLLQSEGFYASVFFSLLAHGRSFPTPDTVRARMKRGLSVLSELLTVQQLSADSPFLVDYIQTYRRLYPEEATEVLDVFLDLTHGVFVDAAASDLWRDHYLAALRLDFSDLLREEIAAARRRWREEVESDPMILYSRLGPQFRCQVNGVDVQLVALGEPRTLSFDPNTVQEGVIRLIPGIEEAAVGAWLEARAHAPFAGPEDLRSRAGFSEGVDSALTCEK